MPQQLWPAGALQLGGLLAETLVQIQPWAIAILFALRVGGGVLSNKDTSL